MSVDRRWCAVEEQPGIAGNGRFLDRQHWPSSLRWRCPSCGDTIPGIAPGATDGQGESWSNVALMSEPLGNETR